MQEAIAATRLAFELSAAGRVDQPVRMGLRDGRCLVMLAAVEGHVGVVVKTISIVPENTSLGLPTIHASVLWMGDSTGRATAMLDGTTVTALRTGAASGVATDLLAPADARVLAMLGAGGQARDQISAVRAVRDIEEVRIWSRTERSCHPLADALRASAPDLSVRVVSAVRDALAGADVVCTATRSTEPIVHLRDLWPGAHVNAIGAYRPGMVELAPDVLAAATVVAIDEHEAAMAEAGDILNAIDAGVDVGPRLTPLGALTSASGWQRPPGVTVFKSVGIAAQDWAVARLACAAVTGSDSTLA
jgi:ornithine cyclodeaminase